MQDCRSTVLLLGDESFNRQLLADGLCSRGYQVVRARSAGEAEEALTARLEMVVVDQRVRGTNGLAWIKRLRERGYTMPVVFCSGSNCSVKTFNLLRNLLNVSIIVRKPIVPLALIDQMESVLQGSTAGCGSSISSLVDTDHIMQFDPPAESENEPWLREYQEEQETKKALEELGRMYLADMPETLYELRSQIAAAMIEEDGQALLQSAISTSHQIKGTAGSLSFPELSRMAADIETRLKASKADGQDTAREPMAQALMVVAEIETWLEDWQDGNQLCPGTGFQPEADGQTEPEAVVIPEEAASPVVCPDLSAQGSRPFEFQKGNAPRVFIADSDAGRVQILANVLRGQGNWQVETVGGGVRILSALEECQPELLILDEGGDGLSGVDICRMIRCHPKWALLPVVLVTADTTVANRRALYQAGASDFIVKPLVEEELASRLLGLFAKESTL